MIHDQVLNDRKILVVNDSSQTTSDLAHIFASSGALVTEAHSGKDAMQFIAWGGYDLIFVHLPKPEADELQVLRFIQQSRPELLTRTAVLADDALDARTQTRLQACYSECFFMRFEPANLVEYALRALAFSDQRYAA